MLVDTSIFVQVGVKVESENENYSKANDGAIMKLTTYVYFTGYGFR